MPNRLANNADLAMYRAKSEHAPGPCYYEPELDEAIRNRRELAAELRRAVERNELEVHYQVQTKTATGEITGCEALLRWTHPQRGVIPPSVFVPIAEENGLILMLGEWVLRRACGDAARWKNKRKVAVNVSALQLAHVDLPFLFHQVLIETGLPPRRLEIELTETAIMADRERALHVLRQIKALGIGVALDDFGTGYSSLETLRAFPFDKIKLDRLFASELEASPQSRAIIRAVLALGKKPFHTGAGRGRRNPRAAGNTAARRLRRSAGIPARLSRSGWRGAIRRAGFAARDPHRHVDAFTDAAASTVSRAYRSRWAASARKSSAPPRWSGTRQARQHGADRQPA